MPILENELPKSAPHSLTRRQARQNRLLQTVRNTEPAQMILRLRRTARTLGEVAADRSAPTADRIAAARVMMDAQSQMLDVIGWPKRPASAPAGSKGTIPVSAQVLDAVLSPLDPPNP